MKELSDLLSNRTENSWMFENREKPFVVYVLECEVEGNGSFGRVFLCVLLYIILSTNIIFKTV